MVTFVARNGKVVHLQAYGMMDIEKGTPMRTNSLFRIASMSKPVTAVAVMMLFEEGAFLLEDPVSKYIPAFADPQVISKDQTGAVQLTPAAREITIRDLMRHTSGIPYGNPLLADMYRENRIYAGTGPTAGTVGEMVDRIAVLPILFNPGEKWEYGLNLDILGRLVEIWSGMTLAEFMETRIFRPLGMNDTFFSVPDNKLDRLGPIYLHSADGLKRKPADEHPPAQTSYFSGGAGLITTAEDYFRFCRMILNGGELDGKRLLSPKTVKFMTSPLPDNLHIWDGRDGVGATHGDTYGLGGGIRTKRWYIDSVGSFMWGGAFHTLFWIDFEEDMVGIFMSQLQGPDIRRQHRTFKNLAYQAIVEQ